LRRACFIGSHVERLHHRALHLFKQGHGSVFPALQAILHNADLRDQMP
jgi:hypothetical protein